MERKKCMMQTKDSERDSTHHAIDAHGSPFACMDARALSRWKKKSRSTAEKSTVYTPQLKQAIIS